MVNNNKDRGGSQLPGEVDKRSVLSRYSLSAFAYLRWKKKRCPRAVRRHIISMPTSSVVYIYIYICRVV